MSRLCPLPYLWYFTCWTAGSTEGCGWNIIQAISSLYKGLSAKGIEATLRKVVEGLAEWFDLSVAQVYDKLFEMMENKKLIVDDGLFCEPGES